MPFAGNRLRADQFFDGGSSCLYRLSNAWSRRESPFPVFRWLRGNTIRIFYDLQIRRSFSLFCYFHFLKLVHGQYLLTDKVTGGFCSWLITRCRLDGGKRVLLG